MTLFPRRIPAALAAFSLLFTASLRAGAEANPPEARATRWVQISAKNKEDRSRIADAGVSIDEADRAVSRIKSLAQATFDKNVLTGIGSFGASYQLRGWKKPVLISSADGVGTKLKVAFLTGIHDTVGEDLVNHCVSLIY